MPGAVGRLFSGGGSVLPALQWGRPPGPRRGLYGGSASVGGLAWQERRAQKGRLMLRVGRCCHCGGGLFWGSGGGGGGGCCSRSFREGDLPGPIPGNDT